MLCPLQGVGDHVSAQTDIFFYYYMCQEFQVFFSSVFGFTVSFLLTWLLSKAIERSLPYRLEKSVFGR